MAGILGNRGFSPLGGKEGFVSSASFFGSSPGWENPTLFLCPFLHSRRRQAQRLLGG